MTTNPATPSGPTNPELAPEPKKATTPTKARATRKPTKSGDPRTDRAAATKKAATPKPIFTKKGWQVALTRNQAHVAYRKQRTLLHGAAPEAYRKAAAKALGVEDEVFLAAFYAPKAEGKGKPEDEA